MITMPEIVAIRRVGTCVPMRRVARSRSTMKPIAERASSDQGLKADVPGRMTIITPANPTRVADHLRHPTGSPRKSAAPAVIASGRNCRIAVASAIGMRKSALR